MAKIVDYFLEEPRRLIGLGKTLFTVGALVILFGVFGWVAGVGVHVGVAAGRSLAEIYPEFWTWWIPETLIGAAPAFLVLCIGMWLTSVGRRFDAAGF